MWDVFVGLLTFLACVGLVVGLFLLAWHWHDLKGRWWARRGRCPVCGYERAGEGPLEQCPECGHNHRSGMG